jgi:hypothetical protein
MGRHTKRTDARRDAALTALRQGRGYGGAARAIGMARSIFADWRRTDPVFGQACEDAREDVVDQVEYGLVQDALTPGNTLAKLSYLRAHRPQLYRVKMLAEETIVATQAATVEHRTVVLNGEPTVITNNIMFRLPDNGRNRPEALDDAHQPETIEGTADEEEAA